MGYGIIVYWIGITAPPFSNKSFKNKKNYANMVSIINRRAG